MPRTPLEFVKVSGIRSAGIVERLAKDIWTEHYTPIIGKAQVDYMLGTFQSSAVILRQIREERLSYFVLRRGRTAIGYLAVQPRAKASGLYLSKLYIKFGARGKGAGREAVAFTENLARRAKFKIIFLNVNKRNAPAISAYQRLGFVKVRAVVKNIGQGFAMDDYVMRKSVGGA